MKIKPVVRPVISVDSDAILNLLTARQHLRPHRPVIDALRALIDELGCCPVAVQQALDWLSLDATQAIGRLRRTELMQLGNAVERFWRRAASGSSLDSSPRM